MQKGFTPVELMIVVGSIGMQTAVPEMVCAHA